MLELVAPEKLSSASLAHHLRLFVPVTNMLNRPGLAGHDALLLSLNFVLHHAHQQQLPSLFSRNVRRTYLQILFILFLVQVD